VKVRNSERLPARRESAQIALVGAIWRFFGMDYTNGVVIVPP